MRNPKYHIYLTPDERHTVINSLNRLKNNLLLQRKDTDSVDECLVQNASLRVRNICRRSLKIIAHALSWCG